MKSNRLMGRPRSRRCPRRPCARPQDLPEAIESGAPCARCWRSPSRRLGWSSESRRGSASLRSSPYRRLARAGGWLRGWASARAGRFDWGFARAPFSNCEPRQRPRRGAAHPPAFYEISRVHRLALGHAAAPPRTSRVRMRRAWAQGEHGECDRRARPRQPRSYHERQLVAARQRRRRGVSAREQVAGASRRERRYHRQPQRAADLHGRVDQARRQARVARRGARHRELHQRRERAADAGAQQDHRRQDVARVAAVHRRAREQRERPRRSPRAPGSACAARRSA